MESIDYYKLVANMPVAFALNEMLYSDNGEAIDFKFLELNSAFEVFIGFDAQQLIGNTALAVFPEFENSRIQQYADCIRTGERFSFENYSCALDKYFQGVVYAQSENQFITLFFDISEQKIEFQKSADIALFYQTITKNASDGVVIFDKNLKYSYVSTNCYSIFGYNQREIFEIDTSELTHPNDLECLKLAFNKALNDPLYKPTIEHRFRSKNGDWVWLESRFTNLYNCAYVNGFVVNFTDITERKKTTQDLVRNEERYRLAQKVGGVGSWEYSLISKKFWNSPQLRELFGVDVDLDTDYDEINRQIQSTICESEPLNKAMRDLINENKRYELEFEIVRRNDGEKRMLYSYAELMPDLEQNNTLVRGIIRDVTEVRSKEQHLKKSEALLTAALKHSRFSIWSINTNYELLYINDTFKVEFFNIFGVELNVGKRVIDYLPENLIPVWLERYKKTFEKRCLLEHDIFKISDQLIAIEVSSTPIIEDGEVVGASFYGENITERKYNEDKLLETSQNLSKLLQASSQFVKPKYLSVDFDEITAVLSQISGAKFVVFNRLYDDYSQTISISGIQNFKDVVFKYLSIDFVNNKWKREADFDLKWINNKTTILPDLASILFTNFKSSIINKVIENFNVGKVAVVRIDGNSRVVGNLILIFENGKTIENTELVEMFSFQLGQYIERLSADEDLRNKMNEMERFHNLTVNREINMIALKKEVNELLQKLGKEGKYKIVG